MEEKHWTVEENKNYTPPWVIRYNPTPGGRKNADGSTTICLSFPALHVTDWVSDPETSLVSIANALNRDALFDEMVEALEIMKRFLDGGNPLGMWGGIRNDAAREVVGAVLSKVREASK